MSKVLTNNKTNKYYDQWIVDNTYGDPKVTKIDRYGDPIDLIAKPQQLELNLVSICKVIFKPNDQKLFEISGINADEAIGNARHTVCDLITDWKSLDEQTRNMSDPYMKHLMSMLDCHDAISYEVI
jgi:hypothetical protein